MMKITVENINDVISGYEKFFGKDFIEQAKGYTTIGLKKYEIEKKEANTHPLFKLWKFLEDDILRSKKNGKVTFSPSSIFLVDLLSNLLSISKVKNIERIINALKNKATFYSAAFEAYVCALYSEYDIEIVEETRTNKSPDFIIKTLQGIVQVECKSLFDWKTYEGNIISKLTDKTANILKKNKRSFYVYLEIDSDADIKKWEEIVAKIDYLSKRDIAIAYKDNKLKTHITIKKMFPWNVFMKMEPPEIKVDKNISFTMIYERKKFNPVEKGNFIAVGARKKLNLDFSNAIFSKFCKAINQLKKEYPSIIHIQIPIQDPLDFVSFTDKYYNSILKQFENDSKRICGVVISATLGSSSYNIKNRESLVFPNYESYNTLPSDFRIPGTGNYNMPEQKHYNLKGTFQIPFIGKSSWNKIPSGILINICNKSGKTQFRLIKTIDNKCRIEIIGIKKELFVLEVKNLDIQESISQVLTFTWNLKEGILLLDGKIIAKKSF